jgi:hypothetical protein
MYWTVKIAPLTEVKLTVSATEDEEGKKHILWTLSLLFYRDICSQLRQA